MINTSNEFANLISQDRKFLMKADLTLANLTAIPLKNSDIMQSGMSFEDAVSGNSDFQVGAAIIGKHVLTLSNRSGQFNDYDFGGATVVPYVGLQLSSTVEYVRKGLFTVDEAIFNGNIVTLECLDNMQKFEKPFSGVMQTFPCTYGDLLYSVCLHCGVVLGTVTFTNSDKIIQSRPADDAMNCLDIVSYIAQNTGNFARCNVDGELELKWYELSVFESQPNLDGGYFDSTEYYEKDGLSSQVVTVQGKNLFDIRKLYQNNSWVVPSLYKIFNLQPNTAYTLSSNVPASATANLYFNGSLTPANGVWLGRPITAISDANGNLYVAIPNNPYREYTAGLIDGIYWIQLELGSAATAYTPFVPNSPSVDYPSPITTNLPAGTYKYTSGDDIYEFTLTDDLRGVGEIKDKVVFDKINNKGYLYKAIGYISSYNGEVITTAYKSTTGALTMGATIHYVLTEPTRTELTITKVESSTAPEIDAVNVTDLSTLPYVYPYVSGDTADGGNFTDYNSGDSFNSGTFADFKKYHHFYFHHTQPTVAIDDVVITGVKVEINNTETPLTAFYGTEGYVISIVNNPLIQSQADADSIAASVGAKIVGMRFRPFSATVLSDPSIEAGDACYLTVRTNQGWFSYQSYITSLTYKVNSKMPIRCDAKTASRNSATRYSAETKTVVEARKQVNNRLTAYDIMVQQLNNLVAHSFGVYKSEEILPDGSTIYYMHDKATRAESQKIWKQTADAFAVSTDGGVTWNAGFDVDGNAVYNVLAAIGINADWIRTGKLLSKDGGTIIDMDYGVASTDNISFSDNIQSGFPLTMPFNIDDSVNKITSVKLKYTVSKFRTYSDTVAAAGSMGATSATASGIIVVEAGSFSGSTSDALINGLTVSGGAFSARTTEDNGSGMHYHMINGPAHNHTVSGTQHSHSISLYHGHVAHDSGHSHSFSIPSHTHSLNFGIMETPVTSNAIDIYIDGTLRAQTSETQGIIELTAFITTVGWHTVEIRSAVLKRVSAQIFIKSYVRM